jgi:hypothetical protein
VPTVHLGNNVGNMADDKRQLPFAVAEVSTTISYSGGLGFKSRPWCQSL